MARALFWFLALSHTAARVVHACTPVASDQDIKDKSCCGPAQAAPPAVSSCWHNPPTVCAVCSSAAPKSLGCYTDKPGQITQPHGRALPVNLRLGSYGPIIAGIDANSAVLTYELCAKACGDAGKWALMGVGGNGYPHGTAAGSQCFCGNEINPAAKKVDDAECAKQGCSGNAAQVPCGGDWKISVFELKCGDGSCGDGEIDGGLGVGWTLVVAFAVLSVFYVGGGVIKPRGGGGAQQPPSTASWPTVVLRRHPHWGHWIALWGLCVDGVQHVRGRRGSGQAAGRVCAPLLQEQPPSASGSQSLRSSKGQGGQGRHGKDKGSSKHRKSSKSSSSSSNKNQRRKGERPSDGGTALGTGLDNDDVPAFLGGGGGCGGGKALQETRDKTVHPSMAKIQVTI